MITVIRRYFRSSTQVVLWVIIAAFIIGLMPVAYRKTSQFGRWALRVNGHDIDSQVFAFETTKQRERIAAFRAQYGEYADWLLASMDAANPQQVALRSLARQELISQFATKMGIRISPEYILARMSDPQFVQQELAGTIPSFLINPMGGINCELLGKFLKSRGLSAESFEYMVEQVLTEKLVTDVLMASSYVPQFDIEQHMRARFAKRNFSILSIPLAPILAEQKKKMLTEEQISTFYDEQNQKMHRYWIPEKRSGTVWTFEPKNYRIVIPDEQIAAYYENNKVKLFIDQPATIQVRRILFAVTNESHRAQMQEKAARVRDQILGDPSKFVHLAKSISDDVETAKNGGLMPAFARGQQEQAIDRAAFLLPEDGVVSDIIATSRGYELLQRVSKKSQTYKSLASVRDEIKNTLVHKKFEDLFVQDIKRVVELDAAAGNDNALLALVKEKGGKPQHLADKQVDETPVIRQLFALKGVGDAHSFVQDQKGIAIKLTKVDKTYIPVLDTIKSTVKNDLYEQCAREQLEGLLNNAKVDAGTQSLEEIKGKYRADLTKTGWLEPNKPESADHLKKKGLPVDQMLQIENNGAIMTHIGEDKGYLVRLDEIVPVSGGNQDVKMGEARQQFEEERMRQYQEGFIASLYRNATIETNDSLITIQE